MVPRNKSSPVNRLSGNAATEANGASVRRHQHAVWTCILSTSGAASTAVFQVADSSGGRSGSSVRPAVRVGTHTLNHHSEIVDQRGVCLILVTDSHTPEWLKTTSCSISRLVQHAISEKIYKSPIRGKS